MKSLEDNAMSLWKNPWQKQVINNLRKCELVEVQLLVIDRQILKIIHTNNVEVRIYSTRSSMKRHLRNIGYDSKHIGAIVMPVTHYVMKDGKWKKSPLIAEMVLHANIELPILAHETLHAATTVIREKRKSLKLGRNIGLNEERLAYVQTAILQDILRHFFPKKNSDYDLRDVEWWARRSCETSKKSR